MARTFGFGTRLTGVFKAKVQFFLSFFFFEKPNYSYPPTTDRLLLLLVADVNRPYKDSTVGCFRRPEKALVDGRYSVTIAARCDYLVFLSPETWERTADDKQRFFGRARNRLKPFKEKTRNPETLGLSSASDRSTCDEKSRPSKICYPGQSFDGTHAPTVASRH